MKSFADNTFSAIVTDPPYELGFMGKKWDSSGIAYDPVVWQEALRVLKPGGYLLAFGGSRTYHRLACAIEDAGFEIRDMIEWIYGQGFPKSLDVSKAMDRQAAGGDESEKWNGYGTALKPAHEPICVARKPLVGTVVENIRAHGTGAINIDGCRIAGEKTPQPKVRNAPGFGCNSLAGGEVLTEETTGRFPANLIFDEEAAAVLDEHTGQLTSGLLKAGTKRTQGGGYHGGFPEIATTYDTGGDTGGASRFFYTAKASRAERGNTEGAAVKNTHPTVKPLALMAYLLKLVCPLVDGHSVRVLDPFLGSGTTALASLQLGIPCTGIEKEADHIEIIKARLTSVTRDQDVSLSLPGMRA